MPDVLIVDDNLDACLPLARLLKHLGTAAACVESGQQALDHIQRDAPKLVLLDVMMPGMDGLEVLRRLREDPRTAPLPVVMFSASNDAGHVARARELGANDYWLKGGMDFDKLGGLLNAYLRRPC